jgi:hypothetical protein
MNFYDVFVPVTRRYQSPITKIGCFRQNAMTIGDCLPISCQPFFDSFATTHDRLQPSMIGCMMFADWLQTAYDDSRPRQPITNKLCNRGPIADTLRIEGFSVFFPDNFTNYLTLPEKS